MANRSGCAGVKSSQVAKPAKPAPSFCISEIAAAGTSFARCAAEQVRVTDHEVFDALVLGEPGEIKCHELPLIC